MTHNGSRPARLLLAAIGSLAVCVFTVNPLFAPLVFAKSKATVKYSIIREENPKGTKNSLVLPYAFSTESMGFTVGAGGATKGYGQDQLLVGATVFGSTEEAAGIVADPHS